MINLTKQILSRNLFQYNFKLAVFEGGHVAVLQKTMGVTTFIISIKHQTHAKEEHWIRSSKKFEMIRYRDINENTSCQAKTFWRFTSRRSCPVSQESCGPNLG
jgi:hypothetical protein